MTCKQRISSFVLLVIFTIMSNSAFADSYVITISQTGSVAISSGIYGINYVWDKIPADEFSRFQALMSQVTHYTLARYPGGWNAERLDWADNIETKKPPASPGVDAQTFLSAVPAASFITASEKPIANPSLIPKFSARAARLVALYGAHVAIWEIGNEWWLQNGAPNDPAKHAMNLQNYAAYLAAVVPAMKAINPAIQIYATGDWTAPDDFATIQKLTGPQAWADIDGISVHTYCGTLDPTRLCSQIPEKFAQARIASAKQNIYDSEWAVPEKQNPDDFGIQNATYTMFALQDLAFAGVKTAAYWPPIKNVPGMALIDADYSDGYATGYVFGWMATYYRGTALHTSGSLPAIAARNGAALTVIVPAGATASQMVQINLSGTGMHSVVSAQVMYAQNPLDSASEDARKVTLAPLPTSMSQLPDGAPDVTFVLNPGIAGRGKSFEIARVTLQ